MPRHWTPADLPALSGRRALVTGANSGIGWHTARELARHGAEVTLAVRTPDKGESAAAQIRAEAPQAHLRVEPLDLASLASVQELAERWDGPLDLLVNNAGLMTPPRYQETGDGFELQRRAALAGAPVTSTAAHPGVSSTNLVASEQGLGAIPGVRQLSPLVTRLFFQRAARGAEPTLYAATVAEPGSYTGPRWLRESRGPVAPAEVGPLAQDQVLAGKLWQVSEDLTGVRYDWD